jgi:hypothetical protein
LLRLVGVGRKEVCRTRGAVAYDNESGKGDHRHRNGREESFVFVSLDQLLADFEADVAALRAEEGKNG